MSNYVSAKIQAALGIVSAFVEEDVSKLDWKQSCRTLDQDFHSSSHRERVLIAALNTLHTTAREGSAADKKNILEQRVKILKVNELLRADEPTLRRKLLAILETSESQVEPVARTLKDLQIKLPDSRMLRIFLFATAPLRIFFVLVSEIAAAVTSGMLSIFSRVNLDPKIPEETRKPVLFLHGVNHNQSGFLPGQSLLRMYSTIHREKLGSFYSISYAGVFLSKRDDTFGLYADRVFDKVLKVYQQTKQMPVLVGHSMGGLVSTCLAKKLQEAAATGVYQREDGSTVTLSPDEKQGLQVAQIITLGSPFHGSYIADGVCSLQQKVGVKGLTVYQDMMTDTKRGGQVRRLTELCEFAEDADKDGTIRYYNIGSTVDQFVPNGYFVTEDPRRQQEYHHLGHLSLIMSPTVWSKVFEWLSEPPSSQDEQ